MYCSWQYQQKIKGPGKFPCPLYPDRVSTITLKWYFQNTLNIWWDLAMKRVENKNLKAIQFCKKNYFSTKCEYIHFPMIISTWKFFIRNFEILNNFWFDISDRKIRKVAYRTINWLQFRTIMKAFTFEIYIWSNEAHI